MEAIGIDEINELKKENEELKEKIKKYAAINEQETKDYAELKQENEELHQYIDELKEQLSKSVSNDLTLISVKEFCRKVLNGEV